MMYLIHIPVYVTLGVALKHLPPLPQTPILQGVAAIASTIALAALSWKYFETPILRFKDRKFKTVSPEPLSSTKEPLQLQPAVGE